MRLGELNFLSKTQSDLTIERGMCVFSEVWPEGLKDQLLMTSVVKSAK